ncbi:MAG: nucleoside-diphosphate kinase [Prolixibacteraceae bacterium]|nr:nucleoside-diphosphate kinase [Prolixibacteraceae bacterium]
MSANLTFTIFKPRAVEKKNLGLMIDMIYRNGFTFKAMKMIQLDPEKAETFYREHKNQPFFNDLINYMTSAPVVVAVLEKENAVNDFRQLIGSTDPATANFGTIRRMFAQSKSANAIHGSDSDASAHREINLFFSPDEMV